MFSVPLNCASSSCRSMAHKPELLVVFQRSYKFGTSFIGPLLFCGFLDASLLLLFPDILPPTWLSGSVRLSIELFIWLNFSFPILQFDLFLRVLVILNCLSLLKKIATVFLVLTLNSLDAQGRPWTSDPPTSTPWVRGLQVCIIPPGLYNATDSTKGLVPMT